MLQMPCYLYASTSGNNSNQLHSQSLDSGQRCSISDGYEKTSGRVQVTGFVVTSMDKLTGKLEGFGSEYFVGKLRCSMNSSWIPDRFVVVRHIPVTRHGKRLVHQIVGRGIS